jgi:uncharacterized protein
MTDYHESWDALSESMRDRHRALASLREEIEAIDWYSQRIALCKDESLARLLTHNRDEEIEHAVMTLEWLRRVEPAWDEQLRRYLFTERPLPDEHAGSDATSSAEPGGDLGLTRTRSAEARG